MGPPHTIKYLESREEFLPYELSYIPEDLRKRAKSELFEDEDTRINSLRLLRSMLKNEPDLYWQDDDLFLLSFLRARKFDVKRAFQLVKTFYTALGKHRELYHDYDFADVRRALTELGIGFLPHRDSEGCVVLIIRCENWEPTIVSFADGMRALSSGLVHANLSPATHIAGFKVIFDFNGFQLRHVPYCSLTYLKLFAEALQNCFPGRFRAVHMVNVPYIFSSVWNLLKAFLTKKIKDRFHFHGSDMTKLHKYFPPSILPAEYEGEMPPFDNSEWRKKLEQRAGYLKKVFSYGFKKYKTNNQDLN